MKGGHAPIQIQRWASYDYVNDPFVKGLYLARDYRTAAFYPVFLFHSFLEGGDLPAEPAELAAVVLMPVKDVVHAIETCRRAGKLSEKDGRLFHKRVMSEVSDELAYRAQQAEAGKISAGRRWSSRMDGGQASRTRAQNIKAAREKGRHTEEQWQALLDFCGRVCLRCGTKESALSGACLTKDHILMVSKGGSDSIDNLQPLCRNCNTRSAEGREDYRQKIEGFGVFIERLMRNECLTVPQRTPNPPAPLPTPTPTPTSSASAVVEPEASRGADPGQEPHGNGALTKDAYFAEVWSVFRHVTGQQRLVPSSQEGDVIMRWHRDRIPLRSVVTTLEETDRARAREVRSLAYFDPVVREHDTKRRRMVGAGGQ